MRMTAILALSCLGLAGCALGPDFHRPDPPAGEHVLKKDETPESMSADGHEQHFDRQADLPGKWWMRFRSMEIDTLVAEALVRSPGLQSAQATLRQSQDSLRAGYGVFFPQIGASLVSSRQSPLVNFGQGLRSISPYNLSTLGANVSYVPDLFGGQRRTVEALGAVVDLQHDAALATYLSLTSNVVNAGIARAGYQAQRDATRAIIGMLDEQIRLAQTRYDAGTGAYADILVLKAQQATSAAAVAALEQRMDQSDHLLAQLCGQTPAEFTTPAIALEKIALPAELPDALPSTLARHRPDILAAEASLHQASAEIGVATADLFPSLTLGGTAGVGNSTIAGLLHGATRFWSAQANLAGSVFSGGTQWYTRKAAIDAYDAALAQYQETVLTALEQVADTMRALDHDAQALRAQVDALAAASESEKLARANYEAGTAGYLDLLVADAQYQQARLGYLGAVAQRLQDTVALYAALGGGWWTDEAPLSPALRIGSAP
ncbi:RND efflux system, outer membrane lipoprotein, NodT family [Burkholderiales bacterium]|nr:RND efflux system, outer membrane lipoprotein, NodT family [Burkholderiales bacterium]